MPFSRPTLTDLQSQVAGDIQSELPGTETLLRFSNLTIIGKVQAALDNGQYGYLDYIALQATPFTATGEYLEGWAALKDVFRKPASAATGSVPVAGAVGAVIPAGAVFVRNDGMTYAVENAFTFTATSGRVTLSAAAPGADANSAAGTALALAQAISGVNSSVTTDGPLTGGSDVEKDDSLRSRMLLAYANPPQGGSLTDYEQWALEVPGVSRAWIDPNGMGPLTIVIYFMMDDAEAAHGGFPQGTNGLAAGDPRDVTATGDQLAVANHVFTLQPPTTMVYAVAPQTNTVNLTIAGIAGASSAVKTAIEAAVSNALFANGKPGGTTDVSAIEAAIAAVNGSAGFVITSITASSGSVTLGAAGNIISTAGRLPVLGTITFT